VSAKLLVQVVTALSVSALTLTGCGDSNQASPVATATAQSVPTARPVATHPTRATPSLVRLRPSSQFTTIQNGSICHRDTQRERGYDDPNWSADRDIWPDISSGDDGGGQGAADLGKADFTVQGSPDTPNLVQDAYKHFDAAAKIVTDRPTIQSPFDDVGARLVDALIDEQAQALQMELTYGERTSATCTRRPRPTIRSCSLLDRRSKVTADSVGGDTRVPGLLKELRLHGT
jgi:hypothetical protein